MGKLTDNKKTLVIVLLAVMTAAVVVFAANYARDTVNNSFTPTKADISIIENGSVASGAATVAMTSGTAAKEVKIQNTSGTDGINEYIRVSIFPKFVNTDGNEIYIPYTIPETISGTSYNIGDVTFNLNADWANNWTYTNGYFYYNNVVYNADDEGEDGSDTTELLLESVSIDSDKLSTYIGQNAILKVTVLADAIQSVGGAVEDRWTDSRLKSNDIKRPSEDANTTAVAAFSLYDETESGSAIEKEVTQYDIEQALKMISKISIAYYEPVEENEQNNDEEIAENSTIAE